MFILMKIKNFRAWVSKLLGPVQWWVRPWAPRWVVRLVWCQFCLTHFPMLWHVPLHGNNSLGGISYVKLWLTTHGSPVCKCAADLTVKAVFVTGELGCTHRPPSSAMLLTLYMSHRHCACFHLCLETRSPCWKSAWLLCWALRGALVPGGCFLCWPGTGFLHVAVVRVLSTWLQFRSFPCEEILVNIGNTQRNNALWKD